MLAKLTPAAAATLAFALAALSSSPALSQARMPTHVACVGDSITAGAGSSASNRTYPAVLQTMLGSGVQVRNFGNSGSTMLSVGDKPYQNQAEYTAATTFVSGAGAGAVVDVIIMLGTNDTKSYNWTAGGGGTRAQQYTTDYGAMIDHFANLSTRPVVYLAIPVTVFTNTFGITNTVLVNDINPIIRQLATQRGLPLIDLATPTATHAEWFPDGVHPNDAGYMVVAQIMREGLLRGPGGAGGSGGAGGLGGGAGGSGGGGRGGASGGGAGGGAAGRGGTGGAAGRGGAGGAAGRGGASGGAGNVGAGGSVAGAGGGVAGSSGMAGATATDGGAAGAAGQGGAATGGRGGGTGVADAGVAGAGAGGAGATGGAGGEPPPSDDAGGCGCAVSATLAPGSASAFIGLALLALVRRRSRRR